MMDLIGIPPFERYKDTVSDQRKAGTVKAGADTTWVIIIRIRDHLQ